MDRLGWRTKRGQAGGCPRCSTRGGGGTAWAAPPGSGQLCRLLTAFFQKSSEREFFFKSLKKLFYQKKRVQQPGIFAFFFLIFCIRHLSTLKSLLID